MVDEEGEVIGVRLGIVVRLPADGIVARSGSTPISFIAVDLADGPVDELSLHRVALDAHRAGITVLALVDDSLHHERLRALGVDELVPKLDRSQRGPRSGPFTVVASADEARRAVAGGATRVALDLDAAVARILSSLGAVAESSEHEQSLVLLPGMLGDPRVFDRIVGMLPPRVQCCPVRIDLDDSVGEIAESVLAVAPRRFALAGHSLGGIVALEVWRRAPDRVSRLALLNTSARPPSEHQQAAWSGLRERVEAGMFDTVVEEQTVLNLGPAATQLPGLINTCAEMAERVGPEGLLRQLRAQSTRPDSRPTLGGIDVPTLVLTGSEDAVCPRELQLELARGIPRAVHVTVDGAGHMSPLDRPLEVAAELAHWLSPEAPRAP